MKTTFFSIGLILIVLGSLSACTSSLRSQQDGSNQPQTTAGRIEQLLNNAQQANSPAREQKQLQACELLIEEQQYELAQQVLDTIEPSLLTTNLLARHHQLQSLLLLRDGDYQGALNLLEDQRLLQSLDLLPLEQQLLLTELRASALALLGSHVASAQQRIYIAPLLPSDRQEANHQAIWRSLMMLNTEDILLYLPTAISQDYQAWLQLALIAKKNQQDLDEQLRQLELWQQQWPEHPATQQLPGELALIKELAANRPKHVALLLPLSGKLAPYGKAIRDGFLASYYQAQTQGAEVPELNIFDTARHPDFIALYQQAVSDGAELIIGPLDKGRLRLLFDQVNLPVTTLALNRVDDYGQAPEQLFQFGLAPQDEARQVADIAYLDKRNNALILGPAGKWGKSVHQAFSERWQALDGKVIAINSYNGQQDYSQIIKEALLLNDSEQRAKRMKNLLDETVEFLPRRREDIDMIFLLAKPQQARSIMPLLDFHYASDIPVYGTSRAHAGNDNPQKDRDIEGFRFTDMPWILNKSETLRSLTDKELSSSKTQNRMIALGIDSFQLYPRLAQLKAIPGSQVFGQTGTLNLNQKQQIERKVLFAEIKRGKAKLIPVADAAELDRKDSDHEIFEQTFRSKLF
jgi:outer membrane PBP1 activator LpoA protein